MRTVLAAVVTAAMAAMGSAAASAATDPGGLRQIHYLGYQFEVPATWPVISLAANPHACVRFDRHAVYLGTPGADENCPAKAAVGAPGAVLVQPGPAAVKATTVENPVAHQITAASPRISVTAVYGSDRAVVLRILASASLPPPVRKMPHPAPPRAAARAVAAASGAGGGNFTGQGFDACAAPSSSVMNAWLSSPYRAVGIYIGGPNRGCAQPNLTAGWVSQQAGAGWHFIPTYVGPQAACTGGEVCLSSNTATAASQGTSAADDAAAQAQGLGLAPGTPVYDDMEGGYSSSYTSAVLSFEAAWTGELHAHGYKSGFYSSGASGVTDLVNHYGSDTMPDVIWDAHWTGVDSTNDSYLPAGDWANHQRVVQYQGGVNQTYGGDTINIDQDALDVQLTAAAAAGLPGGPVISDPATGNLEVYATGTDGTLQEIAWRPGGAGWTAWIPLGGSIAGTPSAVYNPASGNLEVYARGTTGALMEKYWVPGSGWSAWQNLGGSITGSPAAIYDQATGNLEVYATGTDGSLQEIAWRPGGAGWTAWKNLGGSISGDPSPVNDTATGNIDVYARGANGPLFQKFWSPTTKSWSAWVDLGGSITGSPAAMSDPATGNLEVYATNSDGTAGQIAYIPGTGWSKWRSLGGAIAGSPSPVYDPADGPVNVFATGTGGPLFHASWASGTGWSTWLNVGGTLTGSPAGVYDLASGNLDAYAITSTGTLFTAWHTSSGWHTANLGGTLAGL